MALTTPSSLVSLSLSIPVELHAFHYWVENFTAWPNDLLDIGHEYGSYALCHWNRARPDSSLHLAVSAFSLAVFGLARRVNKALEEADEFYARSVMKTRKEIKELSKETIDQLLVATMLMASYDVCFGLLFLEYRNACADSRQNIMYRAKRQFTQNPPSSAADESGSPFWKNVAHYKGTAGLLQVRQQQGCPQNLPLDRAVRRPIVSQISNIHCYD